MFKDVAERADILLIARYHQPRREEPSMVVEEVLKGTSDRETLRLGPHGLRRAIPEKHGCANGQGCILGLGISRTARNEERRRVQLGQDRPDPVPDWCASRFAGGQHVVAPLAQVRGQEVHLGGLATALHPF